MHHHAMKNHWHYRPLAALAVALVSTVVLHLTSGQGHLTTKIWGVDFGFARIKATTFLVLFGERFRFPFDWLLFWIAVAAVGIAIVSTRKHLVLKRRANA
jgi:hypothetical protein